MRLRDKLPDLLISRGVRLNSPASLTEVRKLEGIIGGTIDEDILSVFLQFNGFDDDFDAATFISVWSIEKILDRIDNSRLPYIPFADRAFDAEVFEVCSIESSKPIYSFGTLVFQGYLEFWDFLLSKK